MSNMIKIWMNEIRANFLVLPILLVMIGGAASWHEGIFNPGLFFITMLGVVFAHISVNLLNEYSDWRTGIDDRTEKTPFSGGSGNLQKGLLPPSHVLAAARITIAVAFFIGLYLAWISGWAVLILMGIGGITVILYTDYLTKWMVGELFSGITLGSFVVIGSYYIQTGDMTSGIVWASVSPGILTSLLLLLNEFPDAEADRYGGRRHLVIILGKRAAGIIYAVLLMTVYLVPVLGTVVGEMPATVLVCFFTFPLAVYTAHRVLLYRGETPGILPALGTNVIVVLATDFLLAAGYVMG